MKKKKKIPLPQLFRKGILNVIITFVTVAFLTFVLDAKIENQHSDILHRKHAFTVCDLLTEIRHKWPGL